MSLQETYGKMTDIRNVLKGGYKLQMLSKMLLQSDGFKKLPKDEQDTYLVLAKHFEQDDRYLYLTNREIHKHTSLATPETWQKFLLLQETKSYIKGQMAFLAEVAQRKTFGSLVQQAVSGGQGSGQAAKLVQDISGVLNSGDNNKVIILHRIPRPEEVETT